MQHWSVWQWQGICFLYIQQLVWCRRLLHTRLFWLNLAKIRIKTEYGHITLRNAKIRIGYRHEELCEAIGCGDKWMDGWMSFGPTHTEIKNTVSGDIIYYSCIWCALLPLGTWPCYASAGAWSCERRYEQRKQHYSHPSCWNFGSNTQVDVFTYSL